MQILCLDIGSGTQDVLLLNTTQPLENAIQLVLPAPTVLVANGIREATKRGDSILLTGDTMGGGACTQALKAHLESGLAVYAVPRAAATFNDDLEQITSWGVKIISPDEAKRLKTEATVLMQDINIKALRKALFDWSIILDPDLVGVAVLDHGIANPEESQRLSRFRYLERLLKKNNNLEALIFTPEDLPSHFTRMQAVVRSLHSKAPLVLMDTGAAAVLGASLDKIVAAHPHRLAINLGNSHTIAFLLLSAQILGLFEHHTKQLTVAKLEAYLEKFLVGDLSLIEVWQDGGHGSLTIEKGQNPFLAATGPQSSLLASSRLNPYFAAPYGNAMLAGCFGLVKALGVRYPAFQEEIEKALLA